MKDYYQILGVRPDAAPDEIKRAYRKLAKQFHPDASKDDPETNRAFQEISEAYAVLSDEESRRQYNSMGHTAFRSAGGQNRSRKSRAKQSGREERKTKDGHCGACEEGQENQAAEEGPPPKSIRLGVTLTLRETLREVKKEAVYEQKIPCPDCNGTGGEKNKNCPDCLGTGYRRVYETVWGEKRETEIFCNRCHGTGKIPAASCGRCHGTGVLKKIWNLPVRIPAGAYEKLYLPLEEVLDSETLKKELAASGVFEREIYVFILIADEPGFTRKGYHLFTQVTAGYADLVLGGTLRLPTLEGEIEWPIAPGTDCAKRIRLPGRGLPRPVKIGGRGDQYVTLNVRIPRNLTARQKELLAAFQESLSGQSSPASEESKT